MEIKIDERKLTIAAANQGLMWKDVAQKAGLSANALRDIRQGKSTPRLATLGRIAKALNVNVKDLIEEAGE